jgi:hypothetical protein
MALKCKKVVSGKLKVGSENYKVGSGSLGEDSDCFGVGSGML